MLKAILNLLLTHLGLPKLFVDVLEPVLEKAGDTFLADATVAAQPIVAALEKSTIPTKDKLDKAVSDLLAKFKADGKALLPSVAHLAVELALQKVKSLV